MTDYDGKTADDRVAERRARLIAPGVELFGEHGYAGTSIRSSLAAIGIACFWAVASSRRLASYDSRGWTTRRTCLEGCGRTGVVFFDAMADRVGD